MTNNHKMSEPLNDNTPTLLLARLEKWARERAFLTIIEIQQHYGLSYTAAAHALAILQQKGVLQKPNEHGQWMTINRG